MSHQPPAPPASEVSAWINEILTVSWPENEADRMRLFDRLGIEEQDVHRPDRTSGAVGYAKTTVESVDVAWSTPGDAFTGIDFFAYAYPTSYNATTLHAFDVLYDIFVASYGPAAAEWGQENSPAAQWNVNGRQLELYCHTRRDSVVQVGVERP